MRLIQYYLTKNPCYQQGKYLNPTCIEVHSIGTPQPSAKKVADNWNRSSAGAMVHAVLEPNGDVYEIMQYNKRPWADAGYGNKHAIAFEMTEPNTIKYTGGANYVDNNPTATKEHVLGTYQTAVEYTAYLCQKFGLNPLAKTPDGVPVVFSHKEGALMGISSNHADPNHLWNKYGLNMNQFRQDVKTKMDGGTINPPSGGGDGSGEDLGEIVTTFPATPFTVQVKINDLCIREKPTTNSNTEKCTGIGSFTIVEVQNGWGRLLSGAGWIYIASKNYCTIGSTISDGSSTPTPTPSTAPNIYYGVKTAHHGTMPDVKNREDYAGYANDAIVGVKIGVDSGSVQYRVHAGGKWFGKVTGNDWNDYYNGWAGNGKDSIDAIQIYYKTDTSKTGGKYYKATYQVKPYNSSNYYPNIQDTNWESGDGNGTAGVFGIPFTELKISLE